VGPAMDKSEGHLLLLWAEHGVPLISHVHKPLVKNPYKKLVSLKKKATSTVKSAMANTWHPIVKNVARKSLGIV